MSVVIVGGSVSGLSVGLFAARRGVEVTIVDADDATDPSLPFDEARARTTRRPTPQSAHSHAFLAKAHRILSGEAPDVLDAFAQHGVEAVRLADALPASLVDRTTRPGDDDLVVLRARRSTFEGVLRRVVAAEPGVTIRSGVDVSDLLYEQTDRHRPPRVVGVDTDRGPIIGDLVIDASGRRGQTPQWLSAAGIDLHEEVGACGIAY
ncbi:MAG: NAD-binding protein, partial [Actinomycetota bacterium]